LERQIFLLPPRSSRGSICRFCTFNEGQDLLAQASPRNHLSGRPADLQSRRPGHPAGDAVASRAATRTQPGRPRPGHRNGRRQGLRTLLLDLVGEGIDHDRAEPPKPSREIGASSWPKAPRQLDVSLGAPYAEINWLRANKAVLETLIAETGPLLRYGDRRFARLRDGVVPVRLANVVQGSIMVIRAEHTKLSVVENMVSQLLGAGGDLYGAIMTGRRFYIPWIIYRWL